MKGYFDNQEIDKAEYNKFKRVLGNAIVSNYKEDFTAGVDVGIDNWDRYKEVVMRGLSNQLQTCNTNSGGGSNIQAQIDKVQLKLEKAELGTEGQHSIVEGRIDVDSFNSFYVFLLVSRKEEKYNCFLSVYTLSFNFRDIEGLTLEEATECKDEFMRHQALMKLKNDGYIQSIRYKE